MCLPGQRKKKIYIVQVLANRKFIQKRVDILGDLAESFKIMELEKFTTVFLFQYAPNYRFQKNIKTLDIDVEVGFLVVT